MDNYDASASVLVGFFETLLIIFLIISIFYIISFWKIFSKAGQPGWASIIPIYNLVIWLRIIGKPTWWLLMFLFPIVNIYFLISATHLLSKSYGQGTGFTLGLLFFPYIFFPILGFGNYQYVGPAGDRPTDPFNPSTGYQQPNPFATN